MVDRDAQDHVAELIQDDLSEKIRAFQSLESLDSLFMFP